MKQISFFSISLILTISLILNFGCRKGKEDPFLSFRSREQRLIGKWKLVDEKIEKETLEQITLRYTVNGQQKTYTFLYTKTNQIININPSQLKKSFTSDSYRNLVVLYGDTINIKDSLCKVHIANKSMDSTASGKYEIIIDIMKNNDAVVYNNFDLKIKYKDTIWGKVVGTFDCGNTIFYPLNGSSTQQFESSNSSMTSLKWKWDNHKKNRVEAGYMKGDILRLSNNEIIIVDEKKIEDELRMPYNSYDFTGVYYYCFTNGILPINQIISISDVLVKKIMVQKKYQKWERIKD